MRHSVTTLGYRFRKALDNLLYSLNWKHVTAKDVTAPLLDKTFINSPSGWLPLYTMVTFRPDISYETVKWKAERQSKILAGLGWCGTAIGILGFAVAGLRLYQRSRAFN